MAARDIDALIALAEKDVAMGFDGPTGPEVMRRDFMGAGGGLWQELEEAVALGCAISEGGYVQMPWMSVQDIPGDFFDYMVVTGNSVAVRERPDASSTQLGVVSWDVVDLAHNEDERGPTIYGGPDNGGWTKVSTRSSPSVTGYIRNENLRSTADYRLVALRGPDGFRISAFLAGD